MNIDTSQEYILENDRVLLRPLTAENAAYLLPFSIHEPELWVYSLVSGAGENNFKLYLDHAFKKKQVGGSYPFTVFDKKAKKYVGSTRFYDIQPHHKTIQLGFTWYGKDFQGTGLNKHCKYLLLEFAFETVKVERVEFRADANNTRSIAAMKSIGCTVEGILRSNCTAPKGRRSSIVLSILKDEWYQNIKQELKNRLT